MEMLVGAVIALALFFCMVYNHIEISILKYGVLKAMAAQSKDVYRALQELLNTKGDAKINNKEYRRIEKIYLHSLNIYIISRNQVGDAVLRSEILKSEKLEL
ncbi:MAG: hypothetical protein PVG51_08920 [Desulfosarcina sp.]|jgi:hypothetical protein